MLGCLKLLRCAAWWQRLALCQPPACTNQAKAATSSYDLPWAGIPVVAQIVWNR